MADPVSQFLEVASREVAKRELGYDQQMIEEDPEKAEAVIAVGKRFMDDVDDIVLKMTASLAEKYNLKHIPDKMVISLYEAIATEAYLGNISLKSIENNEFVQSRAESEAKEQKRVEVVQEIMDKCADAAFAYTVASAVTISAIDTFIPEKKVFEATKKAVMGMTKDNVDTVRKYLNDYNKSDEKFQSVVEVGNNFLRKLGEINVQFDSKEPDYKEETAKELIEAARKSKAVHNNQIQAGFQQERLSEETGVVIEYREAALNKKFKDQLINVYDEVKDDPNISAEDATTKYLSEIERIFPSYLNYSPKTKEMIDMKMLEIKTIIEKGAKEGKLKQALAEAVAIFENKKKPLIASIGRIKAYGMKPITPEKIEDEAVLSEINNASENIEEAERNAAEYVSIKKPNKEINKKTLTKWLMQCDPARAETIKKNLLYAYRYSDGEAKSNKKDLLLRCYIMQDVHIGNNEVKNNDEMIALMLRGANLLLEEGISSDEVKESLKGAIIDSDLWSPEQSIKLFEDLKDATNKEGVQKVLAQTFEGLNIEGVQKGDAGPWLKVSSRSDAYSEIQDILEFDEVFEKVNDKKTFRKALKIEDKIQKGRYEQSDLRAINKALYTLRETEPEAHDYLVRRLEELNEPTREATAIENATRIAKARNLNLENGFVGEELEAIYAGCFQLARGSFSFIIDKEKRKVEELREKEETTPVVEEHLEENHEEHAETTPENQSKTERDDDDGR